MEFGLGLHVIGTEMNEAARVDRQLRGRSGRQGQHGSARFVLSLEDRPFVTVSRRLSSNDVEDSQSLVKQVQSSIEQDAEAVRIVSYDLAPHHREADAELLQGAQRRAQRRGVRRDMPEHGA